MKFFDSLSRGRSQTERPRSFLSDARRIDPIPPGFPYVAPTEAQPMIRIFAPNCL